MRLLRGLGAAVLLSLLLIAPPGALVSVVGNPWPAEGLAWNAPLTDDAIVGVLAALGWLFWAQFAWCVVLETWSLISSDRLRARVPLTFGFQQHLARTLLTAVAVATVSVPAAVGVSAAATTTATPTTPPSATSHSHGDYFDRAQPPAGESTPSKDDGSERSTRVAVRHVTVQRLDTLWSIAERTLGDGERWAEIASLNEGHVMGDGARFISADNIRPGWRLAVPSMPSSERVVTVRPGDTLASIAADEIGDAARWTALYDENRSVVGADPDLIRPGQVLQLPRRGGGVQEDPIPDAAPPHPTADDRRPLSARAPSSHGDERRSDNSVSDNTDAAEHEADAQDISALRALLATSVCLTAGLATLLASNRRRQFKNRRPGRMIHEPDRDLQRVERAVHETAKASDCVADFLDLALRDLAARQRVARTPLPDVGGAVVDADRLTLLLRTANAECPQPWTVSEDLLAWSVSRSTSFDQDHSEQPSPYPGLVTIGVDDQGRSWMLDLESLGTVTIGGPLSEAEETLRFMVAELAVSAWAYGAEVLLLDDFARDLIGINPERVRSAPAEAALKRAAARRAEGEGIGGDVLTRRRDHIAVDGVLPLVVLAGPRAIERPDHGAAVRDGVVVIRLSDDAAEADLAVLSDGKIRFNAFAVDLQALALPRVANAQLAALLTETRAVADEPTPPASSATGIGEFAAADGALRPEFTVARRSSGDASSILPRPDRDYLDLAATTEADLQALAPAVPPELSARVKALDPGLDADVVAWFDDNSDRPKVRVLGPVDVQSRNGERAHIANIGGTVEFIIYLACRENGVAKDRAAEDLAWSGSTVQNRAHDARRVLGQRLDGSEWLPDAAKSDSARRRGVPTYQLHPDVLVDADLFRRLRARASARGPDGIEDLVTALTLVVGQPFDQLRRLGYGWLLEGDRLDHHVSFAIADVAHVVAVHGLVEGDRELAESACRAALTADPNSEIAMLDLAAVTTAGDGPLESAMSELGRKDESNACSARGETLMKRRR